MKKEDKFIDQLFEAAKKETPRVSFEATIDRFEKSLQKPTTLTRDQKWWSTGYSLNGFLLFLTICLGSILYISRLASFDQKIVKNDLITEKTGISKKLTPQDKETLKEAIVSNQSIENTLVIPSSKQKNKVPITGTAILPNKPSLPDEISSNAPTIEITQKEKEQQPVKTNNELHKISSPNESTSASNFLTLPKTEESELPKVLGQNTYEYLHLNYRDSRETTILFIEQLKAYGFGTSYKVNRPTNTISKLNLNISHRQGLNWKILLKDFEDLEFRLQLDSSKRITQIAYRLNKNGSFSKSLELHATARSVHKFSKIRSKGKHSFIRNTKNKN